MREVLFIIRLFLHLYLYFQGGKYADYLKSMYIYDYLKLIALELRYIVKNTIITVSINIKRVPIVKQHIILCSC